MSWLIPNFQSISIHVPLAGNVPTVTNSGFAAYAFLSTFPLRGTSVDAFHGLAIKGISIHVPLAGNVNES